MTTVTRSTRFTLDATSRVEIVPYDHCRAVGLVLWGDGISDDLAVSFTAAQIPAVQRLLDALVALAVATPTASNLRLAARSDEALAFTPSTQETL